MTTSRKGVGVCIDLTTGTTRVNAWMGGVAFGCCCGGSGDRRVASFVSFSGTRPRGCQKWPGVDDQVYLGTTTVTEMHACQERGRTCTAGRSMPRLGQHELRERRGDTPAESKAQTRHEAGQPTSIRMGLLLRTLERANECAVPARGSGRGTCERHNSPARRRES